MNPWNLVWIVPVSAVVGAGALAFVTYRVFGRGTGWF